MITALIADDVVKNRRQIEKLLQSHFADVRLVASCPTYEDAEKALHEYLPTLLILDIELNSGRTSFELLKTYTHENAALVFITAFSQYAIQAIAFSCCDYVLKPYTDIQLIAAIEKAKQRLYEKDNLQRIKLLVDNLQAKNSESQMIALPHIKEKSNYHVVNLTNVLYIKSLGGNTCQVVARETKDAGCFFTSIISQGIGEFGEHFANLPTFIRIHNETIVNLQFVTGYHKADGLVAMANGTDIPVSRKNKEVVAKRLHI